MADPSDDSKFDKGKGKEKQTIGGPQSHRNEYGGQGDQSAGAEGQPIGGNDSGTGSGTPLGQGAEFGGASPTGDVQPGSGAMPPRSIGTRGTEFGQFGDKTGADGQQGQSGTGQADLGSQAGSALAGRSDEQDLGDVGGKIDHPTSREIGENQSDIGGEGFILRQRSGSDDLQQRQRASSAKSTGGTDFAAQGRGAAEEEDGEGHPS